MLKYEFICYYSSNYYSTSSNKCQKKEYNLYECKSA
uniref:Photosystem II protein I n=1 Tax=Campylaephora sungminbooi TaxID=1896769 RepID=A0A1B0TIC2_9FLOR|nr:photosystem II protein I [Campylaephora sungminbooi]AKU47472.1 photosystem II protein I [Campylaephora sungminbooi]ALN11919.1 photosystem II protein I [Campylaephora sungminbooi]